MTKKNQGGQKKENPKVQKTVMIDNHVLNKALRRAYKLS